MIPYGVVLKIYREYSMDDISIRLEHIKNLGMNTVVIWPSVFWWEDKTLPDYPFHTGKEILHKAEKLGLKIIMETAGQIVCLEYGRESVMKDEYYALTKNGLIDRDHGHYYFGYLNYFHPEVKRITDDYLGRIAQAYAGFPALYGYDIWNETMFESFDEHTRGEFILWLRKKYETVDALNAAWEETYETMEQARYNQLLWASVMPLVDYETFHQEAIGLILSAWRKAICKYDKVHPVIADNIHAVVSSNGGFGERAQDDWTVAANVDEMGISFYPKGGETPMPPYLRSLTFKQINAAARNKGFWISELQSHHQSLFMPCSYVKPWQLRQWTLEAIGQGAKGVIYWKFDNFSKGLQTGGRGLLDSAGRDTERSLMTKRIAGMLENIPNLRTARPIRARVALLYDRLAQNFVYAFTVAYVPNAPVTIYHDSLKGAYKAFFDQGIAVDFVTREEAEGGALNGYRTVVLTQQLNMNHEFAQCLTAYVKQGGVLIMDGKLAQIAQDSTQYASYPAMLDEVTGYTVEDMQPSPPFFSMDGLIGEIEAYYERKTLYSLGHAQVIGTFLDGLPAVLRTAFEKGSAYTFLTMLWLGYYQGKKGAEHFVSMLDEMLDLRIFRCESAPLRVYPIANETHVGAAIVNESDAPARGCVTIGKNVFSIELNGNDSTIVIESKVE